MKPAAFGVRPVTTFLDDPLADLFDAAAKGETVARPALPATYQPQDFTEACKACRGRGRFISYAGRDCGPCFKCKGRGSKTFKTSPEHRATARTNAADRKARNQEAAIEAFKTEQPAAFAWLIANAPRFEFAASLLGALTKFGSLTDNQLGAVAKCIAKDAARKTEAAARTAAAPVVSVERIEQAFAAAAASGLKRLKLRLGAFVFKPAKESSANAGAIYVTEGDDYLGKIAGGKFFAVRACGEDRQAAVIEVAANPEQAAVAFGKRLGRCSCCGAELTNAESIERGIGPICAEKWGW
jgi:hypothetical protein